MKRIALLTIALLSHAVSAREPQGDARLRTPAESGFWDTLAWSQASGPPGPENIVRIGQHREIDFRGRPAQARVAGVRLGLGQDKPGQGTLTLLSGSLDITGDLTVGQGHPANDSFVHIHEGAALSVGGNAIFGRHHRNCDGSLILAGGSMSVKGDLGMGGYHQGGSMIRFHNPQTEATLAIAGKLILDRCALDLTFDKSYTHSPGSVLTLLQYGTREGQFLHAWAGAEILRGPNRFRIDYEDPKGRITLTALPNWATRRKAPNIVLLFSDDQGYADTQIQQHPQWAEKFPMPQLQSLADAGARFRHAYVTGGVCHPSRVGLMTGRYPQTFGADNNLPSGIPHGSTPAQTTVPDRLRALGYRTYGVGKWHLGETVEHHPNLRGFDRWHGMWGGGRSFYKASAENHIFQDQMKPDFEAETGEYLTDRIGKQAAAFVGEHLASSPGQPFFLFVSFTAVHAPNVMDMKDTRFARLRDEFGLTAEDYLETPMVYGGNQARTARVRHGLAAMTLALYEAIGRITGKVA